MSAPFWTVGRFVVETLAANGIDTVFGIPGVHNIELYRGLDSKGVRHVLVHHEQDAGFAADGYARASGRPAAAFVISGPGVTNVLTAFAQAYSDSVPLLIVASTPVRASLGKRWGVLHELEDQRGIVAGIGAFARSARSAEDVADHLRAAFATLRAPRSRPAYLEIPLDLLAEETHLRPVRFASGSGAPAPAEDDLRAVLELLAEAQRPLVIIGGGARTAGAALRQLVEALDGYLVTTIAGKGVLDESHPANLGTSLPYAPTQELIRAADVVIAAGTELSETDIYTPTRLAIGGRLVRIDIDDNKLADQYAADIIVRADARQSLEMLAAAVRSHRGWRAAAGPASGHRARIEAQFSEGTRARQAALAALRAAVPAAGVVFSDMTQIAYLGNYSYPTATPGAWFHPAGYGTLGYALPAALGAKIAQPARAIVALAGDFGVQFTAQELLTAAELELTLPVVVWNNNALGQIRADMRAAGITPIGVVARNPDFVALAAAYGAAGVRVGNAESLSKEVRAALARPGPTLIEAVAADFRAP